MIVLRVGKGMAQGREKVSKDMKEFFKGQTCPLPHMQTAPDQDL
jgi:phosphoketolase